MFGFETYEAFYKSDLQGFVALVAVPSLFLLYLLFGPRRAPSLAVVPDTAPFVRAWAIVFTIETILDPLVAGLVPRWLGLADAPIATWILVVFVLLGDFRIFVLFFRLARPASSLLAVIAEAAAWTLVVPITAFVVHGALTAMVPGLPTQSIWLVYELAFTGVAMFFRFVHIPRNCARGARCGYLEDIFEYALAYYLLWAAADVLIMFAGFDVGWALRVIPNQLYYSFTTPFAYFRFFNAKAEAAK